MRSQEALGSLFECDRGRQLKALLRSPLAARINRVLAIEEHQPRRLGPFSGLLEGDRMEGTEPEHPLAPTSFKTQQPGSGPSLGDLQQQPVAVVIPARLGQPCNAFGRQSIGLLAHVYPASLGFDPRIGHRKSASIIGL